MSRYPAGSGKKPKKKPKSNPNTQANPIQKPSIEQLKAAESSNVVGFDANIELIKADIAAKTAENLSQRPAPIQTQPAAAVEAKAEVVEEFREGTADRTALCAGGLYVAGKVAAWYIGDERCEVPEKVIEKTAPFMNKLWNILFPDASPLDPRAEAIMLAVSGIGMELGPHVKMCLEIREEKMMKTVSPPRAVNNEPSTTV